MLTCINHLHDLRILSHMHTSVITVNALALVYMYGHMYTYVDIQMPALRIII